MSIFAALQIDGTRQAFVAIERSASDTGNFLAIYDGLAVLNDGDHSSYERNVEGLPLAGFALQFRRRREEPVDAAGVMTRRFLFRVGLNLNFVTASKINAAVGFLSAIKFNVQLEILELG